MKMKTSFSRSRSCQRSAFTLVELMVVITIIAALMALTASAVLKFIAVQQTTNTQSSLDRVQSQLARAWSKVKDDAYYKDQLSPSSPVYQWILANLAGTDANAAERVKVIYVKLKLRQAFPMSFNEALNPPIIPTATPPVCPLPALPGYQAYLNNLLITGSSAYTTPYESSACLLMALQRGQGGAGIDPAELTTGGAAGSLLLPGPGMKTLPYLADSWGRPIFFTRAPAGNLYLNPITPASLANPYYVVPWGNVVCYSLPGNNDPGDPNGCLQKAGWGATFGGNFFMATSQVVAQGNTSYKLAPMLASGGPSDWTKPGQILPFDPITFFAVPGSDAMFSTPK